MARNKTLNALSLRTELWDTHLGIKAGNVPVDVGNALSRNAREITRSLDGQRKAQRESGLGLSTDLVAFIDPTGTAKPRGKTES